jgi:hypothetical protein
MFNKFKEFFFGKPKESAPEVPYKVEAPQASTQVKCGCGRSQTGYCVGLHTLTPEEWATHADNPNKTVEKKKPAAKKAPAKPRAKKAAK